MRSPGRTQGTPQGARRFVWPLALSLLAHGGVAIALGFISLGDARRELPLSPYAGVSLVRPIQVTLVTLEERVLPEVPAPVVPEAPPPPAPPVETAEAPAPAPPTEPPPVAAPPAPPTAQVAAGPSQVALPPGSDKGPPSSGLPLAPSAAAPAHPGEGTGQASPHAETPAAIPRPTPPSQGHEPAAKPRVMAGAEVISLPAPEYPPRSRRLGEQGLVLLDVEVLPDGRVGQVRILQAPDFPQLVEAAIAAARKTRFKPATSDGTPVLSHVELPIRFQLDR